MNWFLHFRRFLQNLRLSYKITLISAVCSIVVGTIALIGSRIIIGLYNEQLYSRTADVMTSIGSQLEEKLETSTDLSEYIVSDSLIQNSLSTLRTEQDKIRQAEIKRQLSNSFSQYFSYSKYVIQFSIIYNGQFISAGKDSSPESLEVQQQIREKAESNGGKEIWIYTGRKDSSILCVRPIREIKGLSLKTLGILVMRLDLEWMIKDSLYTSSIDPKSYSIAVYDGSRILYPVDDSGLKTLITDLSSFDQYKILSLNNRRFFVARKSFNYLNWTYLGLVPYNNIFHTLVLFVTALSMTIAIAILLSIIISRWLSNTITYHFDRLINKMAIFEKGYFSSEADSQYQQRSDEIGQLHRNFDQMAKKIGDLIENNYIKQLLIKDAQIKALEQQINPHFLYNTLESINWQAKISHQQQISKMAESLGHILRFAINERADIIPIEKELGMVDSYIQIQKIRYSDRLLYETEVESNILNSMIPKMSIQPLVENAISHALEQMTDICTIRLTARRSEENVLITVENNGSCIDVDVLDKLKSNVYEPSGNGIGLINIDSRIKLIFGEQYGLSFRNLDDGVQAIITLPEHYMPANSKTMEVEKCSD